MPFVQTSAHGSNAYTQGEPDLLGRGETHAQHAHAGGAQEEGDARVEAVQDARAAEEAAVTLQRVLSVISICIPSFRILCGSCVFFTLKFSSQARLCASLQKLCMLLRRYGNVEMRPGNVEPL